MTLVTMGETGAVQLPAEVRGRYGLTAETSFRLIETAGGILLVPQTQGPMSAELARELEEWEALSAEAWNMFPWEETDQ